MKAGRLLLEAGRNDGDWSLPLALPAANSTLQGTRRAYRYSVPSQGRAGPSPGSHQADRRKQYLLLWKGGLGKHQAATMSFLWKAVGKPNLNLSWSCVAGCVGVRELANRLDERSRSPWGDTSRGVVITVWFPWYCMQIISVQQSWTQGRANNRIQTAIPRCDQGPAMKSQMCHRKGQEALLRVVSLTELK